MKMHYRIDKRFYFGGRYVDVDDNMKWKDEFIDKQVSVIADYDEHRPMVWVRVENMINAVVYLDSYGDMTGEGSKKYEGEIREVLRELDLYCVGHKDRENKLKDVAPEVEFIDRDGESRIL